MKRLMKIGTLLKKYSKRIVDKEIRFLEENSKAKRNIQNLVQKLIKVIPKKEISKKLDWDSAHKIGT